MADLPSMSCDRADSGRNGFESSQSGDAYQGSSPIGASPRDELEKGPALPDELGELKERWARQQEDLKMRVIVGDSVPWNIRSDGQSAQEPLQLVGGLDISFVPCEDHAGGIHREQGLACLVVLSYPELAVLYKDFEDIDLDVPYVSGFLGFRECPAFQALLSRVKGTSMEPQVLLVDGFGILHQRGCGSASHLGVLEDMPTIGVGKTLVCMDGLSERAIRCQCAEELSKHNSCQREPTNDEGIAGSSTASLDLCLPLVGSSGATWGMAVCKNGTTRPIFISVGHRLSLATATQLVLSCMLHRVPEPIRQADLQSRQAIRERLRKR